MSRAEDIRARRIAAATPAIVAPPQPAPAVQEAAAPAQAIQAATVQPDVTQAVDAALPDNVVQLPSRSALEPKRKPSDRIPAAMRAARRWLLWRSIANPKAPGAKPRKVPFYADGEPRSGDLDSPADLARLVTFDEVIVAYRRAQNTDPYSGPAFALGPDGTGNTWQGVDLDDVANHPAVADLVDIVGLPGYVERSPSGNGWHAIGYGRPFPNLDSNSSAVEAYSGRRYFTVTNKESGGQLADLADFVRDFIAPIHATGTRSGHSGARLAPGGELDAFDLVKAPAEDIELDDVRWMLNQLGDDGADDRDTWMTAGRALHHQFGASLEAFELWDEWSQRSSKYQDGECLRDWSDWKLQKPDRMVQTIGSLIELLGKEAWAAYRRTKAGAPPEPTKDERIASKSRWTELISTTDCPIDLENSVMPQIAADQALAESQRGMLADELVRRFAQLTPSNRSPFTVAEIKKRIKRTVQARAAAERPSDNWMFEDLAVVRVGGKVAVLMVRETEEPGNEAPVITMTPADTSLYFRDQTVMRYDPEKDKVAPTSMYDEWVSHPATTRYRGIEFEPGGGRAGFYNIWRGFGLTPVAGDCSLFLAHIRDVICNGNAEHFDWLIKWLGDMVQNPGRKPGTAVVLRGGEGAGKGKAFADQLRDVIGARLYRKVSRVEQLIGKFNAHLAGALLIFANESLWGGDPSKEGALKDLITEDRQRIEPKGIDSFEISDYARLLFATNEGWAVPAGHDARRFFVLDVSNSRQGDAGYFKALYAELDNGGRGAFLHYLLNVDLAGFNVHKAPDTAGLLDLKLRRLPTPERWLFDLLHERGCGEGQDAWPETWPCALMHGAYAEYARQMFDRHPMNCNQFGKWLAKRIPGVTVGRKNNEKRHYKLPPLDGSRKAFEKFIGHSIEWDSDAVTDGEWEDASSEGAPDGFDLAGTPD